MAEQSLKVTVCFALAVSGFTFHPSSLPVHVHVRTSGKRSSNSGAIPDALPLNPYGGGSPPPNDVLPPGLSRFLTQRAVQQQLYYFDLNLDETAGNWLSEFLRPAVSSRIHQEYHGINALPTPSSAAYFGPMLATPEIEVAVRKTMGCAAGRGHGGINGATGLPITRNQNPYLKPRYFEYQELVRPVEIATKLMVIRDQIAAELVDDMGFLVAEGKFLSSVLADGDAATRPQDLFGSGLDGFMPSLACSEGRSSPFRLANFDLLKLLATKESVEKLASDEAGGADSRTARQFLRDNLNTINQHSTWVRHNSWIQGREGELCLTDTLLARALLDPQAKGGGCSFVARVVKERTKIAEKWTDMGAALNAEQTAWKRWHLTRSVSFAASGDGAEV